ncbi:type III-B CRISPR-associated protein Cas10/Cmr2 [Acinetobacter sichuanensis]|uniref:Type III-B CRISPR-associated protein Cas10/Cmr2 n=1 Tax=Acinetobacter sichuanensis TaxID=2136183 RepID=A0A371YPP5_9GAMM|nr:type III-B CRISPR-associated protein Cas10/Cmr2 [Acinetobacter sichuanensis]RFC83426.1 type III-B CRISPR-associated protein Cas10/Cmr2 [Acinetobacter sichuanensis]
MTQQYVAILSVGPVQTFIAAARRSRDLWSGSWLLSELAKACAASLHDQGAELIFPNISNLEYLQENSDFSVGNKIQVVLTVKHKDELKNIIQQAKDATVARFKREATNAKEALKSDQDLRLDVWKQQLDDYVEVQTAWALIDPNLTVDEAYTKATALAANALAARKATRDFKASQINPYIATHMLPKSSLDGTRETVVQEDKKLRNLTRVKLSLATSEQLDCAGVVKRLGFEKQVEQFTPYTRVAADAWVEQAKQHPKFANVIASYEKLVELGIATRVRGNQGIYKNFAFDAQYLYDYRLEAAIKEYAFESEIAQALSELRQSLRPLWSEYKQPYSYGVLLLADGDRMGELLDQAKNKAEHKAITEALSQFAGSVPALMRKYQGQCIYSGGDDVLGFVPLHQAYACSKDLSESFAEALKQIATQLGVDKKPTLSVGLAVCHVNTPLSVIRELAAKAEKHAKGDHCPIDERRNSLAVLLSVRSGTDTYLRLPWNDQDAHQSFKQWVNLYVDKQIPTRIAYDTRSIDLSTKLISSDQILLKKIRTAEMVRMLKKTRLATGGKVPEDTITALKGRAEKINLGKLSDELIVARWFAAKLQKDLGKE